MRKTVSYRVRNRGIETKAMRRARTATQANREMVTRFEWSRVVGRPRPLAQMETLKTSVVTSYLPD
jgi:hypothetical protein